MIAYDLLGLQSKTSGTRGIGRYVAGLATALHQRGAVDVFLYDERYGNTDRLAALNLGDKLRSYGDMWHANVDVLVIGSPFEEAPWETVRPPVNANATVAVCYDLIPYRFPEIYLADPAIAADYKVRLPFLLAADHIFAISHATAEDTTKMLGVPRRDITVIGAGSDERFMPPTIRRDELIATLQQRHRSLRPSFVLAPAGLDWRKNIRGSIDAFARLPAAVTEQYQLVVACDVHRQARAELEHYAAAAGLTETQFLLTGFVDDDDLVRFYQTAHLVIFPSFYEGFGLPIIEARRCGAPVICGNNSSQIEVLPDRAARFDPHDLDDFVDHLHRGIVDNEYRARLDGVADSGWSWPRSAKIAQSVLRDRLEPIASRQPPPTLRRPAPTKVAYATLLPPSNHPVAPLSEQIVVELGAQPDLDVVAFVPQFVHTWADHPHIQAAPLITLAGRVEAGEFDVVIMSITDSPEFRPHLDLLDWVDAHVLLHDETLQSLYAPYHLATMLEVAYGSRAAAEKSCQTLPIFDRAASVLAASTAARQWAIREIEYAAPAGRHRRIAPTSTVETDAAGVSSAWVAAIKALITNQI